MTDRTAKRMLILMSDTGGGHRAAAEAIRDAVAIKSANDAVEIAIVDVFKQFGPFPWNYAPEMYPIWIGHGKATWGLGYGFSNQAIQTRAISFSVRWQMAIAMRKMYQRHPADLVVNVHPLLATPALTILRAVDRKAGRSTKFATIVTDLVSTHRLWYQPRADLTCVPTQEAFDRGVLWGMPPEKMRVTGLPVHPKFAESLVTKETARKLRGWNAADQYRAPVILIVGGGAGMGPMEEIAAALDTIDLPLQIAVVAGRNTALKNRLEARIWKHPAHIFGFVTNMPELMAAADVLVTKAGPATISEAFIAGLPVILFDRIPGQEDGNVQLVEQNNAGLYADTPEKVRSALADWLGRGPDYLRDRSAAAGRLAQQDAVWRITELLINLM